MAFTAWSKIWNRTMIGRLPSPGASTPPPQKSRARTILAIVAVSGLGVAVGIMSRASSVDGAKKAAVGSGSQASLVEAPPRSTTPVAPVAPAVRSENPSQQKMLDRVSALETELKELRECVDGTDADGNAVDCDLQNRLAQEERLSGILSGKIRVVEGGLADEKILRKNLEVVVKGHWGWVKKLRGDKTPAPTPAPTPVDEEEIEMEDTAPTDDPAPAADPSASSPATIPVGVEPASEPVEVRLD